MRLVHPLCLSLSLGFAACARSADWPQWLGPNREAVWSEAGIIDTFPANGPKKLWSAPVSIGYSGPAVADEKVFLMDYERTEGKTTNSPAARSELKGRERVLCLSTATGGQVWKHEYDCPYRISYPGGPRCTPTVADGKVYTLGAMGHLHCLDARTGAVVWKKDLLAAYKPDLPMWGFATHPLVYKNLLICVVGGEGTATVAFDKETGEEKWRSMSSEDAGYCPPTVIEAGGVPQLLVWLPKKLCSLDPTSGSEYWSVELEPRYRMSIAAPRRVGDYLYVGGMYTTGVMLKLHADKPAVDVVWHGRKGIGAYPSNSTPVGADGVFYAVDSSGELVAFRADTGEHLWKTTLPTAGVADHPAQHATCHMVRHGDRYFLFSETGDLHIAKLTPEKYQEVGRARLIEPTGEGFRRSVAWSHPAFAGRCVFVRNDKEIACYSLAKE